MQRTLSFYKAEIDSAKRNCCRIIFLVMSKDEAKNLKKNVDLSKRKSM